MNLIQLLLQTSSMLFLLSAIAGLVSGASSVGLIALSNAALSLPTPAKIALASPFAGLCLLLLLSYFATQLFLVRLSQTAIYQLRLHLSQKILAAPLHQLESIGTSRLRTTLTDDIQAVANSFEVVPILCVDLSIVLGCFTYLGWLSWQFLLGMLILLAVGIFSYQIPLARAESKLNTAHEYQDLLFKQFNATIQGIKELKLNQERRTNFLHHELKPAAIATKRHHVAGMTLFAMAASWGHFYIFGTIGIFLFVLPQLGAIAASIISGYVLTTIYLMAPLADIMTTLPTLTNASIALKRIDALGLSLDQVAPANAPIPVITTDPWHKLEFRGITHTYYREQEDNTFQLGPIDFTITPGEVVFLIGGNGSGKSTFAKIFTGLYQPDRGEIYLDGQIITPENQPWYCEHFSAIFADFFLFDRLTYDDSIQHEKQARHYLSQLQLDRKVQIDRGMLSTTMLSQGQRKRLALLTAYLEDRPIYLFDEWASDQDPLFKDIFYTQLLPELKLRGKTVLVITHDDRYFDLADRSIKLDYGSIV